MLSILAREVNLKVLLLDRLLDATAHINALILTNWSDTALVRSRDVVGPRNDRHAIVIGNHLLPE